jgi:hypothetical protein
MMRKVFRIGLIVMAALAIADLIAGFPSTVATAVGGLLLVVCVIGTVVTSESRRPVKRS